jgi:hypothetical protein
MNELKAFYEYIKVNHNYNCLNTIDKGVFSKNVFIKRFEELEEFVSNNKNKNCYINYQPLKEPVNRKTENVSGVTLLAFDIECVNKKTPESEENLKILLDKIYKFIYFFKIKSYMIIFSGNGYHFYIPLGKKIKKDVEVLKEAYKNMIKEISKHLCNISNGLISSDDRKDLAGMLRIPTTYNTKAGRYVKIIEIKENGDNEIIRKKLFSYCRIVKNKKEEYSNLKLKIPDNGKIKMPKTIDELLNNLLVRILFDKNLPEKTYGSRHTSIIFALQSLIYHSGLQKSYEILELSKKVNSYCNISVDLSSCSSKDEFMMPLMVAIKYCKKNGYKEYEEELRSMIEKSL